MSILRASYLSQYNVNLHVILVSPKFSVSLGDNLVYLLKVIFNSLLTVFQYEAIKFSVEFFGLRFL